MRIIFTFALNAGLNLVVGLAVAGALGPEMFGRFAVASMAVIVLGTLAFDWLRLSTTRFVTERSRREDPGLGASLDSGYLWGSATLGAAALVVLLLGMEAGLGSLALALVLAAAICNGRFEYVAALARALFLDAAYLRLVVVRNVLSLALMVGAALAFGTPEAVLAMLAASSLLGSLAIGRAARAPAGIRGSVEAARLAGFARYGTPIVAAALIYQGILLLNRAVATATLGFAAGGLLSLPTDITIRLLLSVGAALDVFLFQSAVRRSAEAGDAAGRAAIARNMVLVGAVLALLAVGWWVTLPAVEALVVPARYHGAFASVAAIMIPGVLAFCLVQFALNPIFQLAGRTLAVLWSAAASLASDGIGLAALAARSVPGSPEEVAIVHSASLVVGLAVAVALAWRAGAVWPPGRDLLAVAAAALLATIAMWPCRTFATPVLAIAWAAASGLPVFAAVLLAADAGGCRDLLARLRGRLSRAPAGLAVPETRP